MRGIDPMTMTTNLPLTASETDLMLFCVRRIARPNQSVTAPDLGAVDWRRFMAAAVRDKALGLVGHALDRTGLLRSVPPDARLAFYSAMLAAEANLQKKRQHLTIALDALRDASISVLLIKGISLADTIYRNMPYRQMSDIDLMFRPEQRDSAIAALAARGFRPVATRNRGQLRFFFQSLGRASFSHPDAGEVDVHWNPSYWTGRSRARLDIDGIWNRSIAVEGEGVDVRRLSAEDDFVLLFLHALEFRGIYTYHLLDLALLLVERRLTERTLDESLARQFPSRELSRLHSIFWLLKEVIFEDHPLSQLSPGARLLAQRFLPDHIDPGLSIREVVSHANTPFWLLVYLACHFFPDPAAYPGQSIFQRYRAHAAHYIAELRRISRST